MLEEYTNYIIREIRLIKEKLDLNNYYMDTLYFGGGTPTILRESQLERIINALYETFSIHDDFEFCTEMRPGPNITEKKLSVLKELKVKRLSIGVQSLNDEILIENGRHHTVDEFYKTINKAREAGFSWINCDLMSGMLSDNVDTFMDSLTRLWKLSPENISIYKMEIFYNTKLYHKVRENAGILDNDLLEIEQIRQGKKFLESKGYEMANNSLFIKNSMFVHRHRKNIQYNAEMLGIGLSAMSYFQNHIFQNQIKFGAYYSSLDQNELPIYRAKKVNKSEEIIRYVVMGFKNLILYRDDFHNSFGVDLLDTNLKDVFFRLNNEHIIDINDKSIIIMDDYRIFADDIARLFYSNESTVRMETHVVRK